MTITHDALDLTVQGPTNISHRTGGAAHRQGKLNSDYRSPTAGPLGRQMSVPVGGVLKSKSWQTVINYR